MGKTKESVSFFYYKFALRDNLVAIQTKGLREGGKYFF